MSEPALLEDYLELITYGFTNPMPDSDEGPWKITAKDVINGEINFISARKTTQEAFDKKLTKKSRPKIGDVLLTKDGTLGRLAIVQQEGICINQSVAVLRPNEKILPEYLFYLLSTPKYQTKMMGDSDGTVIKHIYITRVGKMEVDIPSLEKQLEIIQRLLMLDRKIKLIQQTNQTLEQISQAIFKSWFVDFEPVKAKMAVLEAGGIAEQAELAAMSTISAKDEAALKQLQADQPEAYAELVQTAALFPSAMEESELGEIPDGWRFSEIGNEVTVAGGGTPSTKNSDFWESGAIHWTTPKDLSGLSDKVLLDTDRKITSLGLKKISSGLLPIDTVLMSSRAPVGYLALAKVPVAVNQGYIAMKCSKDLPPEYVIQWCAHYMDEIKQRAGGTTFAEISKKNFKPISVVVPSVDVLDSYKDRVKGLYDLITNHVVESASLSAIRDSLLPKLLAGDLPMNGD